MNGTYKVESETWTESLDGSVCVGAAVTTADGTLVATVLMVLIYLTHQTPSEPERFHKLDLGI